MLDTDSPILLDGSGPSAGSALSSLRWWAIGRLIVIGTTFGLITKYHLIKVWKRYTAKKAMTIHTMIGMVETFKFCIEDVFRDPVPGGLDLVIAMIHNASAAALTTGLLKGNQRWTRPGFQANFVIRITLGLIAYFWSSPGAHRTSVNLNHGAIYIRLGITFLRVFFRSYADLYTMVSLCAGIICFETGSYESGFAPQGLFVAITLVLVPLVKYLTDLNVDLELDDPITLQVKTQAELPSVPVAPVNALQLQPVVETEKQVDTPRPVVDIALLATGTPSTDIPATPLMIRTDVADLIASPVAGRSLTLSALQQLDAALSPLAASHAIKTLHTRDLSQAGSSTASSAGSSHDELGLLTPDVESPQLLPSLDERPAKTKMALAPIDTSLAGSNKGPRSAPWTALLRSPSSALSWSSASGSKDGSGASVRKELRILAARAGLSPLKEWQSIRKWDRAREAAASAAAASAVRSPAQELHP